MTLTEQIAHLRKRLKKATEGPWSFRGYVGAETAIGSCGEDFILAPAGTPTGCDADDAALIVAMRNALPAILDHLEQLDKERNATAADLWCAEDQWGDDYLWEKWGLSKTLTKELKDRLMEQATNEEGKQ